MKERILVWCFGQDGTRFFEFINAYALDRYEIIGYTDNSYYKKSNFFGLPVYEPRKIVELDFDFVVIACDNTIEIKRQIVDDLNIEEKKIKTWIDIMNIVRKDMMIEKYKDSEDDEIKRTLKYWETHELSTFNQWGNQKEVYYEIKYDEKHGGYPYIDFYGRRMYYPQENIDLYAVKRDGKEYLINILEAEQYDGSPHLYITDTHKVEQGDVVVDVGTCEGNFGLLYIDIVSKLYLVECDATWTEALKLTFEPYKDKVVFVNKFLADRDTDNSITLDSLLAQEDEIHFLKMDIEGAETGALLGGIDVLKRSNAKISVCAYHRECDEKYIRFILESLGYQTSVSEGYMVFYNNDKEFDKKMDFRRGVVYARKG